MSKPCFLCEKIDRVGYQVVEFDEEGDVGHEAVDLCEDVVNDVHEEGLQMGFQPCCVIGTENTSRYVLPPVSA